MKQKLYDYYQRSIAFVRFVVTNFIHDECTYFASALAFTTLLAIVPLMTVGFTFLSSFPVFQEFASPVQDFIFQNFVPTTGKLIQGYLQQFTAQVSKLSIWGVVFLFITALLVMFTIEQAMNKIWRVRSPRHGAVAFLLYWAILSLSPVLLGLSLAASSYLISLPFLQNQTTPSILLKFAPYTLSFIGFTFLYLVVPNRSVKFRHGLIGGMIASILFESAKLGFGYYLTNYNTYQLLYGAFAIVPIFFIWIYWVWCITLLGAEISYALSVYYQRRVGASLHGFVHALLWLQHFWLAQQLGKGLTIDELIETTTHPYSINAEKMLNVLTAAGLIHETIDGEFRLSRDMSQTSLYELAYHLPFRLPYPNDLKPLSSALINLWEPMFNQTDAKLKEILNISLENFFQKT